MPEQPFNMRVLLRGFACAIIGGLVGFVPACLRIENENFPIGPGGWTIAVHQEMDSGMLVQLGTIAFFIGLGGLYGFASGYVRAAGKPARNQTQS
jgi:hypothetical protein